jgi:hypothetical protein
VPLGLITAIEIKRANSLRAESISFHGIKRKKEQQLVKSEDNKANCRFPTATQERYSRSLHEQQLQLDGPHQDHIHCRSNTLVI